MSEHEVTVLPGCAPFVAGKVTPTEKSDCCKTEGHVIACDGQTDVVQCWVCGCKWTQACK